MLLIFFVQLFFLERTKPQCQGLTERRCCDGYRWDVSENECVKCPIGFFGVQCLQTCRYPAYGEDCQMTCNCTKTMCDPVNGCPLSKTCAPGTLGTHCQYRCRYPAYGLGCQMTCDCNESQCDAKMGCEHLKNDEVTTIFPEISEVTTEQQLEHSSVKLLTILTIEKENFTHVIIFVSTTIFLVLLSLLTGIALAKRYKCQCRFVNKKGRGYVSGNQQKLRELRSDESIKTRNDAYISAIPDSDSNLSVLKIREDGFSDEHRGHLYDDVDSELSGSTTLYLDPFEKDNPKSTDHKHSNVTIVGVSHKLLLDRREISMESPPIPCFLNENDFGNGEKNRCYIDVLPDFDGHA